MQFAQVTMVTRHIFNLYRTVRSTVIALTVLPIIIVLLTHLFVTRQPLQTSTSVDNASKGSRVDNITGSLWEMLSGDSRVSMFADIVGEFDDIVLALSNPRARFTIYAPVNEAFSLEFFPPDLPWFYWKLLAGYHMGPSALSAADLAVAGTVPSYVNADIFFEYPQRVSVQRLAENELVTLNHKSKLKVRTPMTAAQHLPGFRILSHCERNTNTLELTDHFCIGYHTACH